MKPALGLAPALLVGAVACARVTGPEVESAGRNFIVIDDNGALADHRDAIRGLLTSTLERTLTLLPLTDVTITITADASRAITGYGLGGSSPNGRTVNIAIDPLYPGLARVLPDRLPPTLAHELHHCMRWRGPGYGRTLLEALISEGLADHFAVELLAVLVPPWSDAFPRELTAHFLEMARPEFDSSTYDHARWFFDRDPTLPRWTAYTLGFRLVETYIARHPGSTAAPSS